ncbi:aldehyde ferredoxin oxidoreductase family protein [Chloroflexota bacterium]
MAYIDLSNKTIVKESVPLEWRQKYLGARGINNFLLYSLASLSIDPMGPDNPLIIGVGLFTGLPGFGSGRFNICAVSPESGNFGDSNIGGHFGAEMKYAGYDHLVIRGKSKSPVYLMITNGDIEIRDAKHLWGKDTWQTQVAIKQDNNDERIRVITIGVAGENLVRMAQVISGPKDAAGKFGMGCVMGSKNLKAIAARGTMDVTLDNPGGLLNYYKEQTDILMSRKWINTLGKLGTPLMQRISYTYPRYTPDAYGEKRPAGLNGRPDDSSQPAIEQSVQEESATKPYALGIGRIFAEDLLPYSVGMSACFGCAVHCRHRHLISEGPYATRGEGPEWGMLGSGIDAQSTIYIADQCNLLGLRADKIRFTMQLLENGIITEDDIGRPLRQGNMEDKMAMLDDIAHRRGFGDILADGSYALKRLPAEAANYMPMIKNYPCNQQPGGVKSFALQVAVSSLPTHIHRSRPGIDIIGLPQEVFNKVYGRHIPTDYTSYEGRSYMIWWHELLYAVCDSLGLCRFQTVFNSPNCPQYAEYSELIRLALGWDISAYELKEIAERIYTTERLLLGKFGIGAREDDYPPENWFTGPKWSGLDINKYETFLDEYYELHGWDKNGVPAVQSVGKLEITEANIK